MVVEDWNSPDLFSIAVISPSMCSRRRSNSFAKSDSGVPGVYSSSRDLRCVVVRLVIVVFDLVDDSVLGCRIPTVWFCVRKECYGGISVISKQK